MRENLNYIPQFDASKGLEFGLYTLGDHLADPHTGTLISPQQRLQNIKKWRF